MSAVIVLQQMLVLFSMIAIGVFLWKKNWIDVKGQKALSKMVVNIFNPLLLIYSISGYDFEKSTMNVGQNMVFVIVYFVLLFLMGFVVAFLLRLKTFSFSVCATQPQIPIFKLGFLVLSCPQRPRVLKALSALNCLIEHVFIKSKSASLKSSVSL